MIQTQENGKKAHFETEKGPSWPNSSRQFFFFFYFSKISLRQSLDIMVSFHHVIYQKKLMIQSWENLVTERRTDGREWFHRTLSDWCRASNTALPDTPRLYVSIFGNEARFEDYVHTFSTNRMLYFVPKR